MGFLPALFLIVGCSSEAGGGSDSVLPDSADQVSQVDAIEQGDVEPDLGPVEEDAGPGFDLFLIDQGGPAPDPLSVQFVEPAKGKTVGGEQVVLTGTGFVDGMTVMFGYQWATDVYALSSKKAMAITPAGFPGPVDVQVFNPDGQSITLENGFLYYNSVTVLSVDPAAGPTTGGVPIMISGTGFSKGGNAIIGDKIAVDVKVLDDSTILAVSPPADPGHANVSVSSDDGMATLIDGFFYYDYPKIISLSPAAAPAAGGSLVHIKMVGAHEEGEVYFDDEPALSVSFIDYGLLEVTAPPSDVGYVDVTVVTPYGSDTREDGFFFYGGNSPPKDLMVVSVQPDSGPTSGGNTVQIAAFGLSSPETSTVLFGAKVAEVVAVNPYLLVMDVVAPASVEGPVDVKVINENGNSVLEGGYTYLPIANVLDVSPGAGPAAGGTQVMISGEGFLEGAEAYFGALPAQNLEFLGSTQMSAITPVGSPGPVDVRVLQAGTESTLEDGFIYEGDLELFVVDPNFGSIAGGTYIKLVGSGFVGDADVYVGGVPCSHVTVEAYNVITAKTPPGAPGTVDVEVVVDGDTAFLPMSYTYFDPVSFYGGTWGGDIYHAVNVTVLDGSNEGMPLNDAFVMLWADPDTPYQGFTDINGKVTFSGPELLGDQMVTASKECYSNASVVEYNASNVTLILYYNCPSMGGGGGGGGGAPPIINGRVWGFGKYVVIPPGPCINPGWPDPNLCKSCEASEDGGGGDNLCANLGEQGKHCLTPCVNDTECPLGFSCTNVQSGAEFGHCLPLGGKKMVYCNTSKGHYLGANPYNGEESVADEEGYFTLLIDPRDLGEKAVVCVGGVAPLCYSEFDCTFVGSQCIDNVCYNSEMRPEMESYAMGVERHLMVVAPGQVIEDVNIIMDIPMNRKVNVYFDDPHLDPLGPNIIFSMSFLDFGSDGVFEFMEFPYKFYSPLMETVLTFDHLPSSLSGNIMDATFAVFGAAVTNGSNSAEMPKTYGLLTNLTEFEDDSVFIKGSGGVFEAQPSGIQQTLFDLWGDSWSNIYGVGLEGTIVHFNGYSWQIQPGASENTLRSVYGVDGKAWAVGDKGQVSTHSGVKWEKDESFPQTNNLKGVWASAETNVVVVGEYGAWRWDGNQWNTLPGQTGHKFNAVWGVNSDNVWAVGDYGKVVRLVNGMWVTQFVPTGYALYDVWGTSPADVWAVGDSGTILRFDGQDWSLMDSGTMTTLKAVYGTAPNDVYIVGTKGTILHWDGDALINESVPGTQQDFLTVFTSAEEGLTLVSGNHQIVLSPFVTPVSIVHPAPGSTIQQNYLEWHVDPGPASSFYSVALQQPSMMGPVMFWDIVTDGDVTYVELPDFPNIEGTPGLPTGFYIYSVSRVYKEGFDIDNYDFFDFNYPSWRSWSDIGSTFEAP